MTTLPVSEIWYVKGERQRQDLGDLTDLINSIQRNGLINPITVTRDKQLVAGERRLASCKEIGLLHVPVRYLEDLPSHQIKLIEYDENAKRKDIDWKEQVRAVNEYTNLYKIDNPDASGVDVANELGMSSKNYYRLMGICEYLNAGHPAISAAPQLSVARGIWERTEERKKANDMDEVSAALGGDPLARLGEEIIAPVLDKALSIIDEKGLSTPIFNEDFLAFTSQRKFNFIHCDFPYGIDADKHDQGAGKAMGGYEDTLDLYIKLLIHLGSVDYIADSAHLMFWFSMEHYNKTVHYLEEGGWTVNPFPLIWLKSDNSGILPDPKRGPRRIYETAFLAYRGDRPVVRSVSNAVSLPTTKEIHMSEKPRPVLAHFFRMFVDEYTVMLDPTCGSGNSVIAAHNAGAKSVTGLEINPEFCKLAEQNWKDNT